MDGIKSFLKGKFSDHLSKTLRIFVAALNCIKQSKSFISVLILLVMNTNNKGRGDRNAKNSTRTTAKKSASPKKSSKVSKAKPTKDAKVNDGKFKSKPDDKREVTTKEKRKYSDFREKVKKGDPLPKFNEDAIRLNKYLSNAGICSRREADVLIATGVVSVNDVIVTELGFKIAPTDVVKYDGGTIKSEKKQYVLLNKPKGFITTMDDPLGRKTVMSLVVKACKERVYPVGRLDRETTGLLLFTNDGDMAKKLTHPQTKTTKLYDVELNKGFNGEDMEKLLKGVSLDDGTSRFDKVEFIKGGTTRELGVEIHSGKNRIVRRTFEALGYEVLKLDRVKFAGLSKKDLPRGNYRHLTEKEVAFLKMS